ncbi:hypothetical protein L0222_26140 [bacterium]|nr:hypothetical protein [bacterium]
MRPNERFSGRGSKQHLCKDCRKLPANVRLVKQAARDVWGFLDQSNISRRNIKQLKHILAVPDLDELFQLASVILQIARVKPHKRKRFSFIKRNHPQLWKQMIAVGIVEFHYEYEEDSTDGLESFIYEDASTD